MLLSCVESHFGQICCLPGHETQGGRILKEVTRAPWTGNLKVNSRRGRSQTVIGKVRPPSWSLRVQKGVGDIAFFFF